MDGIGSGLRDYIERAPGKPTEFDAHVAGLSAELLHCVGERKVQIVVDQVVHVGSAVERIPQVVVARTIDADLFLPSRAPGAPALVTGVAADRRNAWREQHKVGRIAAI